MIDGVKEYNQGRKAGKKSGCWDLGSAVDPVRVGPNNILDLFIQMEAVAGEDRQFGTATPAGVYALVRIDPADQSKAIAAYIKFEEV